MALCIPVAILHAAAFGMGYFVSKLVGFSEVVARTVSIETGTTQQAVRMLQPGMAVPLACSSWRC